MPILAKDAELPMLGNVRKGLREWVQDMRGVLRDAARKVESRLRIGTPGLGESPLPLSTEFGEKTKEKITMANRKFLANFPLVKGFQEKRIIK